MLLTNIVFCRMYQRIIIKSTIAFIFAAIVEMTLHEAAHFIASVATGGHAILHHNYVEHKDVSDTARIITASAGPAFSLLIGFLFQLLLNTRRYKGMNAMVILYLSFFGYIGFLGYMMIAPFFAYGDTGFVLRAIGSPTWLIIALAIASIFFAFLVARSLSVHFIGMMSTQTVNNFPQRRQFINCLVLYPLFIGIAITTLLNMPVPTTLSLIAPLTSPFIILWPFGYYLKAPAKYYDEEQSIRQKISTGWIIATLLMIIVNRLLVPGFTV